MGLHRRWVLVLAFALPLAAVPPADAGFDPPACDSAPFLDVGTGHPYCEWIQQFELDGITTATGCGGGNYCPNAPVTRAQLAMHLERAMRGTDTWEPWQGIYRRTLVVSPVLSGDPPALDWPASGDRLLEVLAMLPTSGPLDPWQVILEPGIYDIGSEIVTIPEIPLTIRGAGGFRSLIYSSNAAGSVFSMTSAGSLVLADLGFQITGSGGGSLAAIQATAGGITLERTQMNVNGAGDTYGLRLEGNAGAEILDSTLNAGTSSGQTAAVYLNGGSTTLLMRSSSGAGAGGTSARGVLVDNGTATLEGSSFIANSGATTNYGLALFNDATVTVEGGDANASSATSVALYVQDSDLSVEGGKFVAGTRAAQCLEISVANTRLTARRAAFSGSTSLYGSSGCTFTVTFSSLSSAVNVNGGTITCRAVTDGANNFLASTCP